MLFDLRIENTRKDEHKNDHGGKLERYKKKQLPSSESEGVTYQARYDNRN